MVCYSARCLGKDLFYADIVQRGGSGHLCWFNARSPERCSTRSLQILYRLGLPEISLSESLQHCTLGLPGLPHGHTTNVGSSERRCPWGSGPSIIFLGSPMKNAFYNCRIIIVRRVYWNDASSGVAEPQCCVLGLPEDRF